MIPGSGRSPEEENGNPLQYSCLENPMDRGAWQVTVHGVAKNRTQLSDTITNSSRSSNTQWLSAYCMYALIQKNPRGVDRFKATSQTGKLRPREVKLITQVTQ